MAFTSDIETAGNVILKGVYLYNGTDRAELAVENTFVPEGNGQFKSFPEAPALNAHGHALFYASLKNTSGGDDDNEGLYLHDGTTLTNIVRSGTPLPGGDGKFDSAFDADLNAAGQVSFIAWLTDTSDGYLEDEGIYLASGGTLTKIAHEGETPPEGDGVFHSLTDPIINSAGQIVFRGFLRDTPGNVTDDDGVYMYDGSTLLKVARGTDPVPDGAGTFEKFERPYINGAG